MKKILLLFTPLFLLTIACRKRTIKEYINTEQNSVQFYLNAHIIGMSENINIQAGNNNYYMYSNFNFNNTLNTFEYYGIFKKNTCTQSICPNSIKISFIDSKNKNSSNTSIPDSLFTGNYQYALYNSIHHYVLNTAITNPNMSFYSYYLNNINTTSNQNIQNMNLTPGIYTLTLLSGNNPGCSDSLSNILNLSATDNFYACYSYTPLTYNNITFNIISNTSSTPSYTINFGDSTYATSSNNNITHTFSNPYQTYLVTLMAQNPNTGKIITFKNKISPLSSACINNFNYTLQAIWNLPNYFNKLSIEYTDNQGIIYSSAIQNQPQSSYFQIIEISDYQNNELSLPTKKIKANFKVRVFSINNPLQSLDIEGETTFAIAYEK